MIRAASASAAGLGAAHAGQAAAASRTPPTASERLKVEHGNKIRQAKPANWAFSDFLDCMGALSFLVKAVWKTLPNKTLKSCAPLVR
jgi:hypothetical protein